MALSFIYIALLIYIFAIAALLYGFEQIETQSTIDLAPKIKFSIVVPFRNEAQNLPKLLASFANLNYPLDLFEVLLIDDDSDDNFKIGEYEFVVRLEKNSRTTISPKKDAITKAVSISKNDWITTTDADCIVPENWLLSIDNSIQVKGCEMVLGSVRYENGLSFLKCFQQLDLASLQGATVGSFGLNRPFMCNAANMAFSKDLFNKMNGFEGNSKIASGDDVFLLQKAIALSPEKAHYLKSENSIVTTQTESDWRSLFMQRVRWASKTTSYKSSFGLGLGIIVLIGNISFLIILASLILYQRNLGLGLLLLILKILFDYFLINKTNKYLQLENRYFLICCLLYPLFSNFVAIYSMFGKYEWKGRRY